MNKCINCQQSFVGKYCNNCGQKESVRELTFSALLQELWHSITHTDRGILKLVKDLFLHPKSVYINYFEGQRKKYFSPVTFFLITAGILLLIGDKIFDYQDYKFKVFDEFGRYVLKETKYKTFIILPFTIFLTFILAPKKYNLAKNIVFWLFLNGLLFTTRILATPIYFIFIKHKSFIDNSLTIIQILLIFYHLILVFGNRKWVNIILCFLFTNLIFIGDYMVSGYLLFGEKLFQQYGSNNFWKLIIDAYKL